MACHGVAHSSVIVVVCLFLVLIVFLFNFYVVKLNVTEISIARKNVKLQPSRMAKANEKSKPCNMRAEQMVGVESMVDLSVCEMHGALASNLKIVVVLLTEQQ